jgi:uncharacterized membrane protein (UPF0182 family)
MWSRRRRNLVAAAAIFLLLLILGRWAADILVDVLWFRSLGIEAVFWTQWAAALTVRAALGLAIGAFVFANLWAVSKSLGAIRVRRRYANIEIAERLPRTYVIAAVASLAAFSGWWLSAAGPDPLDALAAIRNPGWGVDDPQFGRDVGFYVFLLPILERLQVLTGFVVFWTATISMAAYVGTGALRMVSGRPSAGPGARRHLGLLLAAFLVVIAWDAWLDRYTLLFNGHGIGGVLGYTDVAARLPGQIFIAGAALAAAAAVAHGAWHARYREAAAGLLLLPLAIAGATIIYPTVVQKLYVEPNELPRERPFIEWHLDAALAGFGLSDMRVAPFPYRTAGASGAAEIDASSVRQALDHVPLWDPLPLRVAFDQQQSLFPYYDFPSVNLDRYGSGNDAEQLAIAVRELDPSQLPQSAQTWQNLHLNYTSGEGVVASPVARMAADGAPAYYLYDLDPPKLSADAPPGLRLTEPRVYFGETAQPYIILSEPDGPLGVPLEGPLVRLVYALAMQSRNLLLSNEVGDASRIVYNRSVLDRARAVAPFLEFTDDSPYPVIQDGHVVWIIDGYTTSASFPLSPAALFAGAPLRYVRNSAKVVIDGVTGAVRIFAMAPDPILETYARIFPGLIRPAAEMPAELRGHLRFPPAFLNLQAAILGEYHLSDARAFYEKEDVWTVPTEKYRDAPALARPMFVTMPLPGAVEPEFLLTMPFVSPGRQNMTALLVTRNDPPAYGEQILYQLPRQELIAGPQQIEALIDSDPEISQQLALWRRSGSEVIRGHLVVVPVDSTIVYVEPLYLEAVNAAIPQLERVILAHDGRIVMAAGLDEAVAALAGGSAPERQGGADGAPTPAAEVVGVAAAAPGLVRARELMREAEAHLRAGDWAAFGRAWQELQRALDTADTPSNPPP